MAYQVVIATRAARQLAKLDAAAKRRVQAAIDLLSLDPRPPSATKLVGDPAWRVRTGNYRIVYEIENDRLLVLVIAVGHRRDIYKH